MKRKKYFYKYYGNLVKPVCGEIMQVIHFAHSLYLNTTIRMH